MERVDKDRAPGQPIAPKANAAEKPGKVRPRVTEIVTERLRKKVVVRRTINAAQTRHGA